MDTNKEFIEWLKIQSACIQGMESVKKQTPQDFWDNCSRPDWLLWLIRRMKNIDIISIKKCAIAFARTVQPLMKDERSIFALDIAEKYLIGQATIIQLERAKSGARDVVLDYHTIDGCRGTFSSALAVKRALCCVTDMDIYLANHAADDTALAATTTSFRDNITFCNTIRSSITPNWDLK